MQRKCCKKNVVDNAKTPSMGVVTWIKGWDQDKPVRPYSG